MATTKRSEASSGTESAAELISKRIQDLGDWRGETLAKIRSLIKQADPEILEEWKWMGTPVWSHDGIVCTGETYKSVVKMTFAKGASLEDPSRLFNSSLDGNVRRAIDIREGEKLDERALKQLIRAAISLNVSSKQARPRKASKKPATDMPVDKPAAKRPAAKTLATKKAAALPKAAAKKPPFPKRRKP